MFLQDPTDGGCAQMQAGPSKYLGDLYLAKHRAKRFDPLHDVPGELRKPVDWLTELHECIRSFFIHDEIVADVTKKALAVCSSDQPRAAFISKMAICSEGRGRENRMFTC